MQTDVKQDNLILAELETLRSENLKLREEKREAKIRENSQTNIINALCKAIAHGTVSREVRISVHDFYAFDYLPIVERVEDGILVRVILAG